MHDLITALHCPETEIWAANPPGHIGSRLNLVKKITELTDMYFSELKQIIKPECYLFGHSMGGSLIYFLAQKVKEAKEVDSQWLKGLIISASAPPCSMYGKKYSELPEEALISQIMQYNAMPDELLHSKELMELMMPVFRADYKILEDGSEVKIKEKLDFPAYLVWGERDTVESIELLVQWRQYLNGSVMVLPVKDGEHMLVHHNIEQVATYIENILAGTCQYDEDDEEF